MPDLLAHVLLAYAVVGTLSLRFDWIDAPYITIGMAGAMIPDLSKAELLVDDRLVEQVIGVPFDWFALHTAGGVLVSVLIGTAIVGRDDRKQVFLLLGIGAITHLLADGLLRTASGRSYSIFWPLVRYQPPTPGWYLSTELSPMVAAGLLALTIYAARRHLVEERAR